MDKTYLDLFKTITHHTELLAEKAMETTENKEKNTAQSMRDDYAQLYDKLRDKDFNENSLTRAEFAKFFVGAFIVSQNLETQIKTLNKVLQAYKIDTMPKLERIVNETNTDEEALKLANEIFQVIEKSE